MRPALVWLRQDLRIADNPALAEAVKRGPVIPIFIWSPDEEGAWAPGAASRWWLHQSLKALDSRFRELGSRLVLRQGPSLATIRALIKESGADAVYWNRRYEPASLSRDAKVEESLRADGLRVESFNGALLHEPRTVANKGGKPFQVFTPFWKHCLGKPDPAAPLPAPQKLASPSAWPRSVPLPSLELEPKINWANGLKSAWAPGESGARANLDEFLSNAFTNYEEERNRPDHRGTSRLSPHLHFGELGPRQIWHQLEAMAFRRKLPPSAWRNSQFLAELGWREFAHHLLFHFPHTTAQPLRAEFQNFPWNENPEWLAAWQKGRTGYPIVDAGMRELWHTGWMHNRVRMIVASFLVKDLLLPWTEGARWFWDTLVDADLAQNTLGWQWTAGCGADAAPFFRIFNPTAQGEKFDPDGAYVRRWCPELSRLPAKWIHRPDKAPADVVRAAGIELGVLYPEPIVNHSIARDVALERFSRFKSMRSPSPLPT